MSNNKNNGYKSVSDIKEDIDTVVGEIKAAPTTIENKKSQLKKDAVKKIKKTVNKRFKKQKGAVMKAIIKFFAKLVWKVTSFTAIVAGIIFVLNKFAPDVLDNLNSYLKELRDE